MSKICPSKPGSNVVELDVGETEGGVGGVSLKTCIF